MSDKRRRLSAWHMHLSILLQQHQYTARLETVSENVNKSNMQECVVNYAAVSMRNMLFGTCKAEVVCRTT